jgi:hypothetical protein
MRKLCAVLAALLFFSISPAKANELSGFYEWARDSVVNTRMTVGVETGQRIVTISVTENWSDDKYPPQFQDWLPYLIVCETWEAYVEAAEKAGDDTWFEVRIVHMGHRLDESRVPAKSKDCAEMLVHIEKRVRGN